MKKVALAIAGLEKSRTFALPFEKRVAEKLRVLRKTDAEIKN